VEQALVRLQGDGQHPRRLRHGPLQPPPGTDVTIFEKSFAKNLAEKLPFFVQINDSIWQKYDPNIVFK
jgi:hypothetical protein